MTRGEPDDDTFAQLAEDRLADRGEQRNLRERRRVENYSDINQQEPR